MLRLGSTYLKVKDMEKSVEFYSKLLEMKPSAQNFNRWAQFDFHNQCIALWNPKYDENVMESNENLKALYSRNYIEYSKKSEITYGNNVVLNFYTDHLNVEYQRLKALNIGEMTPIMLINVATEYYLFILKDPDGNEIEITGHYQGDL